MTEQQPAEEQAALVPRRIAGRPVEVAKEVLDSHGEHTAGALRLALRDMTLENGGRDDVPALCASHGRTSPAQWSPACAVPTCAWTCSTASSPWTTKSASSSTTRSSRWRTDTRRS